MHAHLLVGDNGEALLQAAFARASTALAPSDKPPERHPDCHILDNQGKAMIVIDMVREWRNIAQYLPNEANCHVFVMPDADKMNHAAQNALLALLEDPPTPCLFLLLCRSQDALLQTVRSRVCIHTIRSSELGIRSEEAELWAENVIKAMGSELNLLCVLMSAENLKRPELCQYLECLLETVWHGQGLTNPNFFSMIESIKQARAALDSNVGNGNVLAALCAAIAT